MLNYVSRVVNTLNNTVLWLWNMGEKELVNEVEEEEEDEGYNSFEPVNNARKTTRKEFNDHTLDNNVTLEEAKEKFKLLKQVYSEIKDEYTRLHFEVEILKDDREEREEQITLMRREIGVLQEEKKVMIYHNKQDRSVIHQQKQIIQRLQQQ